jgi:hypothetical protein
LTDYVTHVFRARSAIRLKEFGCLGAPYQKCSADFLSNPLI